MRYTHRQAGQCYTYISPEATAVRTPDISSCCSLHANLLLTLHSLAPQLDPPTLLVPHNANLTSPLATLRRDQLRPRLNAKLVRVQHGEAAVQGAGHRVFYQTEIGSECARVEGGRRRGGWGG